MITYTNNIVVPGRRSLVQSLNLKIPLLPLTACAGIPTAKTLNRFATACHVTAASVLVGGLVAISVVAHSSLPTQTKAAICAGSGLVMLGSYYCCKLSTRYAMSGSTLEQFVKVNQSDPMDLIDDFEEEQMMMRAARNPDSAV